MISIQQEAFGTTKAGEPVSRFILTNGSGVSVWLLSYGCAIQKILVPLADGSVRDVVLGYDTLAEYEKGSCYFGVCIGRYANRIRDARFTLGGREYRLSENDGKNHLHGTFEHSVFSASVDGDSVLFTRTSPDGEEGYPGELDVSVRYTLAEDGTLSIAYTASAKSETVVNLTNHSYFNLNGQDGSNILSHRLSLSAHSYTEAAPGAIPSGVISPVSGTAMDFTVGKEVGRDLFSGEKQLEICGGYDHNFIVDGAPGTVRQAAVLTAPDGKLSMICRTTQPALQFYCGIHVHEDRQPCGKGGTVYPQYGGLALETQHYPCSPNFPEFPSTVLRPGELYSETTEYRFVPEKLL